MTLLELQLTASRRKLLPSELAELISLKDDNRASRLKLDRESQALKKEEDSIEELIISQMRVHQLPPFQAGEYTYELGKGYEPRVDNWEAFQRHIIATGDFSLLEKRVGRKAVYEQLEHGVKIPGIEKYPVYSLIRTKDE